jgi:hypothetical protein
MLIVLITALVAAATVYNVVAVVAAGFDCPKTLYVVAIKFLYPPINKNGLNVSPEPAPLVPALPVYPRLPALPV